MGNLYENNESEWRDQQISLLESGRVDELDYDSMLQLLLEMSASERRSVEGLARVVVLHLLKFKYQPERASKSWLHSIISNRATLKTLTDTKTLLNHLHSALPKIYTVSRRLAIVETELPSAAFPSECPFTISQILDDHFFAGYKPPWA